MNTQPKPKHIAPPEAHKPTPPLLLDLVHRTLSRANILQVRRVGFHGHTADDRSPESFPFPACLTSYMETIGEGYGDITIYAHNRSYTKRLANSAFLGASGMAFGLLWSDDLDYRTMDLSQITPREETIDRAFRWAGHAYTLYHAGEFDLNMLNRLIMQTIDAGIPVLAFGLCGSGDCSIIAGYENFAASLIGWSHFQSENPKDCTENGMFRLKDWDREVNVLIIPGEKTGRTLTYEEAIRHGCEIMRLTEAGVDARYAAGQNAHEHWQKQIAEAGALDEAALAQLHRYHCGILFNFAECRAWGADFLRDAGYEQAAVNFMQIHDLCWKARRTADTVEDFSDPANRKLLKDILQEISKLDASAASLLEK